MSQLKTDAELLTTINGGGELLSCLDVDGDPGLEVYGEMIIKKRP